MTREQADKWARVCAELTEDLPSKINFIGKALVKRMATANKRNPFSQFSVSGMEITLLALGIPYKSHKDGDIYRAAEIAGEMFYVSDSSDADADDGEQEGA